MYYFLDRNKNVIHTYSETDLKPFGKGMALVSEERFPNGSPALTLGDNVYHNELFSDRLTFYKNVAAYLNAAESSYRESVEMYEALLDKIEQMRAEVDYQRKLDEYERLLHEGQIDPSFHPPVKPEKEVQF